MDLLGFTELPPADLIIDNQSAIKVSPRDCLRSQHFLVKDAFLQKSIAGGVVNP